MINVENKSILYCAGIKKSLETLVPKNEVLNVLKDISRKEYSAITEIYDKLSGMTKDSYREVVKLLSSYNNKTCTYKEFSKLALNPEGFFKLSIRDNYIEDVSTKMLKEMPLVDPVALQAGRDWSKLANELVVNRT